MAFGAPISAVSGTTVAEWQTRLETALTQTMDRLAEASADRMPDCFAMVFRGTAGVGGPYDLWRRIHAAFRGRRFDAHHQPGPPA